MVKKKKKPNRGGKPAKKKPVQKPNRPDVVAYNVRRLRSDRGLTQSQLAEILGLAQSRVAQIEAGGQDRRLSTIQAIADSLNVGIGEITKPIPAWAGTG